MKRTLPTLAAVIALAVSGAAAAQYSGYDRYDRYERYETRDSGLSQSYDWGEVISVEPIISTLHQPIRRNECWSQPVVYREPARYYGRDRYYAGHRDRTPALVGAIVGGAIGNQFGSGSGRDAATIAGAALGYSTVRDSQRRHGYGGYYVSGGREYQVYEQRCAPRTDYVRDERVNGYDVTYRYRGEIYRTTTDYHPGDRIQIRVDVRPVR
jgi:uncharacterized protein YcfJ